MDKKSTDGEPNTALLIIGAVLVVGLLITLALTSKKSKTSDDNKIIPTVYKNDSTTQNEIDALKDKINELENKPIPQTEKNTADIVEEWKGRVAQVMCKWTYQDGTVYQVATGSSTLVNTVDNGVVALTNKHVILTDKGYLPAGCKIYTWTPLFFREVTMQSNGYNPFLYVESMDLGEIQLETPATMEKKMGSSDQMEGFKACTKVNIGDKLVVLGYPAIGADVGITVTEGIISGIEQNYYVTDAKIDHGNSGGAAVLVKDDCWLGIPSSSAVGTIESMGRILKGSLVFKK